MTPQGIIYPFAVPGAAFAAGVAALLFSAKRKGGLLPGLLLAALAPAAALWAAAHFHAASGVTWGFTSRSACLDMLVCACPLLCLLPAQNSDTGRPLAAAGFMLLSCAGACALARGNTAAFIFPAQAAMAFALTASFGFARRTAPARWIIPAAVCAACSAYGIALMLAHPAGALHAAGAALFCSLGLYLAGIFPFNTALPEIFDTAGASYCSFYAAAIIPAAALSLLEFASTLPQEQSAPLKTALAVLAILSSLLASLAALKERRQGRIAGLMAASASGWLICPAVVPGGMMPALSGAVAHALAFTGLCAVLSCVKTMDGEEPLAGLAKASPGAAFALLITLASYAGLPFTAGFIARFHSLSALINYGGAAYPLCAALLLTMLLNAALAVRLAKPVFFGDTPAEGGKFVFSPAGYFVMVICSGSIIGLGLLPQILFELANIAGH